MAKASRAELLDRLAASGCAPFSYDSENQQFHLGDQHIPLTKDALSELYHAAHDVKHFLPPDIDKHILVTNLSGDTYSLPRFLDAYKEREQAEQLAHDTVTVMQKTLSTLADEQMPRDFFEVWLRPRKPFDARVLSVAALHPLAEGSIGEKGWPYDIFEYGTNNADLPEWEIALYAGLGHVAAVAEKAS